MVDYASQLHVEHINGVTLIQFPRTDMDEGAALAIESQLFPLAEKPGCTQFVLSLSRVRCLSSTMLGKLIAFNKQVKQRAGELILCSLSPDLAARFESMRLNKLFHICSNEEEALWEVSASIA
jgi:stage II sporulation protein AA (anti-sigma F factor antagonist)